MATLIIILLLCPTQSLTMLLKKCPVCKEDFIFDLAALDTSRSTGHEIAAKMLKCTAENITPSFIKLFNLLISTGVFLSEWKTGRIVPIPKGNNQSEFRPILIVSILSKLLEW